MNATRCEMSREIFLFSLLAPALGTVRRRLHTFIDDWRLVTVVNQSRQLSQVVLVGQRFVMNLHEADSKLISLVVNVLELLKSLGTFAALGLV